MNNKDIRIELDQCDDAKETVWFKLNRYNKENCEFMKNNSTYAHIKRIKGNFALYDKDELVGGALGEIYFGWYHLTDFCLDKKYRGKNYGTEIIKRIEEFAKENKAIGVKIGSWSFQAPKFYEKLGYTLWTKFEDCPPGTTHYYFYKKFN